MNTNYRWSQELIVIGPIAPPLLGPSVKNKILIDTLKEKGIQVEVVDTHRLRRKPFRLLFLTIKGCVKRQRIFLSTARNGRLVFIPILCFLSWFLPVRKILLIVGGNYARELRRLPGFFRLIYLNFLSSFDLLGAETTGLADQLNDLGLGNVEVFPNFKPDWNGKVKDINTSTGKVSLVFLSRVKPEKGIEFLFQALDILHDSEFSFVLDIYGSLDSDYKQAFDRLIANRPYANYKGIVQLSRVFSVISHYDLMVFPTLWRGEGFPGVLVDASIAGIPVIATDFAYNSEIIQDGFNGLLVNPGDPQDLADKIRRLIDDPDLRERLARNNKQVSKRYTVETVIGETLLGELEKINWWEDG